MARKKKSGFGKFIGSLGGNPYDRLMGQFERTVKQNEDDDNELANELDRFVRIARTLKNISKTNIILTFFSLIKIHLEKSIFFCRTSAAEWTAGVKVVVRLRRF